MKGTCSKKFLEIKEIPGTENIIISEFPMCTVKTEALGNTGLIQA